MRPLYAVLAAGLVTAAGAEEPDVPELDFLEYLGSWQAEDEEWVIAAEWEKDAATEEADEIAESADGKPDPTKEKEHE